MDPVDENSNTEITDKPETWWLTQRGAERCRDIGSAVSEQSVMFTSARVPVISVTIQSDVHSEG